MSNTKLLDLFPPSWATQPIALGLAQAAGQHFDHWRALVGNIGRYFDANGAPADSLDWLMNVVGLPVKSDLAERRKRNLIANAFAVWAEKGLAGSISYFAQAYAGTTASVANANASAFVAGVSKAGDTCGPGLNAWHYEVYRFPQTSAQDTDLRTVLKPVAPAFCSYAFLTPFIFDPFGTQTVNYKAP